MAAPPLHPPLPWGRRQHAEHPGAGHGVEREGRLGKYRDNGTACTMMRWQVQCSENRQIGRGFCARFKFALRTSLVACVQTACRY